MVQNLERYSTFAILMHWLMALLIFTMFGLGWYMVELPEKSPERAWFLALHKSIGLTIALLALIRLGWRLTHKPPALPEIIAYWKRKLANVTHHLLYVLMFVQPVSGCISSSFSGYKTKFWGMPLPHWGWEDRVLNELFTDIHVASSIALLCLIILHISGTFYHWYYSQDFVLKRMLPAFDK